MAKYTSAQRKKFATVAGDKYPIGDKKHAKAALMEINKGGLSPAEKAKVKAKADKMLASKKKKKKKTK